jgi:ribonuclease-3
MDEGGLTRLKINIVSGSSLSDIAANLGLDDLIVFGSSELGTLGRGMTSALENCFEALVGAIYLDGGFDAVTRWVLDTVGDLITEDGTYNSTNPKSALQELLQQKHITPTYELLETAGPPHDRLFKVCVLADDVIIGHGEGHSKKDAEVNAASQALATLAQANTVE